MLYRALLLGLEAGTSQVFVQPWLSLAFLSAVHSPWRFRSNG